jgi:archaellum component FlaC
MEKQEEGTTLNDKQKYLIEQEETLHSLEANLKEMESQYRGCQKEAKSITNQIERVFETIECDR